MSLPVSEQSLTILGEIASGGMGTVELARMAEGDSERFVAVKRMHPEYARDPEFVRMFRDEIWLTGSLSHPNVVGLVGFGEDEGGPYLVMEYVDGIALARIVLEGRRARDPFPEELVAFVAARAAEALHAAHALADDQGRPLDIVHRDVTPSNILVAFDGTVKLTDFGIAKATGKSSHTRTGIIKGKIAYMSPEYAARRPVDGRADLYSLGIVMFEVLAGKVPFEAKGDLELLKLVAYASPAKLRAMAPGVDAELAAIVDRLLSKNPSDRFADGAELALALDGWLRDRRKDPDDLAAALSDYAKRHAGTAGKKLARMLDDDVSTVPGAADSPKRPRFETRTFTAFKRPPRPEPEPDDEPRPRTRKVALSNPPPPPVSQPTAAATAPLVKSVERLSQPPPPTTSRAQHSSAVVGGVIAGSLLALLLVVVSVVTNLRRPPASEPLAAAPSESVVSPPPPPPSAETQLESLPTELPPPVEPSAEPAPKAKLPPASGKVKPVPARVPLTSKGTKPCTPDSFDYPGCLKR